MLMTSIYSQPRRTARSPARNRVFDYIDAAAVEQTAQSLENVAQLLAD